MSNALADLSNSLAEVVARAAQAIVVVNEGGRSGVSGTIWRQGLIVTAEHTIRDQQEVTLVLAGGGSSTAVVVGRDPSTDVALLRAKDSLPPAAEFADPAQLGVGHVVLAIGRRREHGVVAAHGIVSAVGGAWRTWQGGRIDHWFRLDLLPFTGFSGGPLVDAQARVVGINTSGPRRSVVTVPAPTVNRVVDELLTKGRVARGFIGVALQPVQLPPTAPARRGLLVVMVEPGGPAEKAGLMIGDIIIALGDKPLETSGSLQAALDPEQVGTAVVLRILRAGKAQEVPVQVGERPQ